MSSGSHLDRVEASVTDHGADALGMIRPGPEPQHAEEVTRPPTRGRPEIDGRHAPAWSEDAADLQQPAVLQLVGQVVKHQAAEHHVEVVVRVRERLDRRDLEAHPDAGASGVAARERDHLRGRVDSTGFSRLTGHEGGHDGQPAGPAPHVEDPLT
jgi:hypothetical protein